MYFESKRYEKIFYKVLKKLTVCIKLSFSGKWSLEVDRGIKKIDDRVVEGIGKDGTGNRSEFINFIRRNVMDRRRYILKRFEKELRSLGYEEPFLYRDEPAFIAAIFPMNEDTDKFYTVQISWSVDDGNDRILFRAERVLQEVCAENEFEILHFCNEWNKNWLYGTAVYDRDFGGLYLSHTLPLPDRVSDMFLFFQVYHNLAFAAEKFFEKAEKFKWLEKKTENTSGGGGGER